MLRSIVLLIAFLAVVSSASISGQLLNQDDTNGRIVGGRLTDITKHPHQVSLRYKKCPTCAFRHICGGSIVTDKVILTAAHCVFDKDSKKMHIVAGTNERTGHGIVIPVDKVVFHEDFSKEMPFDNDIAILVLKAEMPLNGWDIRAIQMTETRPSPSQIAQVTGWGQVAEDGSLSDFLLEVEVPIIDNDVCDVLYKGGRVNRSMICAVTSKGGRDACSGDSGGPLLVKGVLTGVVSWGDGCGRPEFPGVYSSIADLRPWIDDAIKANS